LNNFEKHLILKGSKIENALLQLNKLSQDAILFVVDEYNKLIGALTDGDVRRGLIKGITIDQSIDLIIQPNPRFIRQGEVDVKKIMSYRESNFRIIPLLDKFDNVIKIINFRDVYSYLPVDAVIMAGGKGQRLLPLTENTPKPLLKVGDKPIIEHNIDRLTHFGVDDFWVSIKYLGEQIETFLGNGESKNVKIKYLWEKEPLGTIGAVSLIDDFQHENVIVSNSDLLTNLDYEDFYVDFLEKNAYMSVVTIPYQVKIPYAVLETDEGGVINFAEKPTYTYFSNGGIYLFKRAAFDLLKKNDFFNATDLMEKLIKDGYKVISYPLVGYWLDIGNPLDYERANIDIKNIKF